MVMQYYILKWWRYKFLILNSLEGEFTQHSYSFFPMTDDSTRRQSPDAHTDVLKVTNYKSKHSVSQQTRKPALHQLLGPALVGGRVRKSLQSGAVCSRVITVIFSTNSTMLIETWAGLSGPAKGAVSPRRSGTTLPLSHVGTCGKKTWTGHRQQLDE